MKDITDCLEKEQVDQVLAAAGTCTSRDYLIMRVLWRKGTRVSELLNITPAAIEFKNQVVNITKAKGGKQRRVLLDGETLNLLSEYILQQNIGENQPIFGLSSVHIWRLCQKYGKMIGVDVHPHMLRHSYAIHLIRNGLDLRRLQQLLGHSNIQTTTVYLQFRDQDLREGYNKIEF